MEAFLQGQLEFVPFLGSFRKVVERLQRFVLLFLHILVSHWRNIHVYPCCTRFLRQFPHDRVEFIQQSKRQRKISIKYKLNVATAVKLLNPTDPFYDMSLHLVQAGRPATKPGGGEGGSAPAPSPKSKICFQVPPLEIPSEIRFSC